MSANAPAATSARGPRPSRGLWRLPTWEAHWRDLQARPDGWMVIGRNLVPAVGVLALGWSRSLAVFNLWFDGLVGLAAILAMITPRAVRETAGKDAGPARRLVMGLVTWAFLA